MKTCVFPGSFDPLTLGHLDLITRASCIFDRVTVTVMHNRNKRSSISPENRVMLIRKCCAHLPNVVADQWDGLLSDYLRTNQERVIIRGVRNSMEFENEKLSLSANLLLNDQAETVFLCSRPSLTGISSSAVKEILSFGGDISAFVPPQIAEDITRLLSNTELT